MREISNIVKRKKNIPEEIWKEEGGIDGLDSCF